MVTIYTSSGDIRFQTPVNTGSKRVFKLMGDDYVTLLFNVRTPVKFTLGDYCDIPDAGRFELCKPCKPTYNAATGGYGYELKLEAQHIKWRNKIMRYLPQIGGNEAHFTLTAPASVHLDMVVANANALATEVLSDESVLTHAGYLHNGGTDPWEGTVDASVDASAKTITYDGTNILDALTSIAEEFDCEWWMDGRFIRLGKCEGTNDYIDLELGSNVADMAHSDSQESLVTRILAFGSDRNISPRYRKDLVFNVTATANSGRRVSDSTRVLDTAWFPDSMVVQSEGSAQQASFTTTATKRIQSGQPGTELISTDTQTLTGLEAGKWELDASGLAPKVRLSSLDGGCNCVVASLAIEGVKAAGGSASIYREEREVYIYTVGTSISVSFSSLAVDIAEDMASVAVTLAFHARVESNTSVTVEVSPGTGSNRLLLTRQDRRYRVEGITLDRVDEDGSVLETFTGAVLNPDYEERSDLANVIELPAGSHMEQGHRFTIREIRRSKVKSSYFTSRYSAYSNLENVTTNGVVTSRLMIPESYGKPYVDYRAGLTLEEGVEDVVVFEDIYPKAVCTVTGVSTVERTETVDNDDETTTHKTFTAFRLQDSFFTSARPFDTDYIIPGKTLEITFLDGKRYENGDTIPEGCSVGQLINPDSGKLNGWTFEVLFTKAADGSAIWEVVRDNDSCVPNDVLRPEIGDTFVITGCDMSVVDELYAVSAEQELLQKAIKYLEEVNTDPSTYDCTMMPDVMKAGLTLGLGKRVNLVHPAFFDCVPDASGRLWGRKSRVIGYEYKLDIPWDNPVYTIGNKAQYSRLGKIEDDVEALKASMRDGGSSGTGSVAYNGQYSSLTGGSLYVIGTDDSTPASDSNVFSALRTRADFTMRSVAEKLDNVWTFLKGLRMGRYVEGYQGAAVDEAGNAEVESLKVRSYLKVFELIYNRLNALEGNTSFADVGTVDAVAPGVGEQQILTMRKRWEGDFTAFQPGDVVYGYINNLNNGSASEHMKAWAWVQSVDRTANTLTVVPYPDNMTPAGMNHALTPNMVITRWGNNIEASAETFAAYGSTVIASRGNNEYRNVRQSSFYISCEDGNLVELMGVHQPILEPGNYGTVLGKIPDNLLDGAVAELVNKDQPYLFARGIIVQDLIRVDYQGVVTRTANYRGVWNYATACNESTRYRRTEGTYDTVTWNGSLWQCVADGNTDEPSEATGSWVNMTGNQAVPSLSIWQIFPNTDIVTIRYTKDESGNPVTSITPGRVTCEVLKNSTGGDRVITSNYDLELEMVKLWYSLDGIVWEEFSMGTDEPLELEDESGVIESETSTEENPEALTIGGDDVSAVDISDRIWFELRSIPQAEGEEAVVKARAIVPVVRDGVSYSHTDEYYQWSSSRDTAPTGTWVKNTVPVRPSDASRYLWNYEVVTRSDGTSSSTEPHVVGSDGKEITGFTEKYLWTVDMEQPSASVSWDTTIQNPTDSQRYLWNMEVANYNDGTASSPNIRLIAARGSDGTCFTIKGTAYAHSETWPVEDATGIRRRYLVDGVAGGRPFTAYVSPSVTTEEAQEGDGYVLTGSGELFVANGTEWVSGGIIKGDQGPQGEQGPKGEDGEDGKDGKDGIDGRDGLMAYPAGYYNAATEYVATGDTTPVVMYGDQYFVLKRGCSYLGTEHTSDNRGNPALDMANGGDDARWELVEKFNAIFADIILANFAKLSSAVIYGDWLISQQGTLSYKVEYRYQTSSYAYMTAELRNMREPTGWRLDYPTTVPDGEDIYMTFALIYMDDTLYRVWSPPLVAASPTDNTIMTVENSTDYQAFKSGSFEPNFWVNFKTGEAKAKVFTFQQFVRPSEVTIDSENYKKYITYDNGWWILDAPKFTNKATIDSSMSSILSTGAGSSNSNVYPMFKLPGRSVAGQNPHLDEYFGQRMHVKNNTGSSIFFTGMSCIDEDSIGSWSSTILYAGYEVIFRCVYYYNSSSDLKEIGWVREYIGKQ